MPNRKPPKSIPLQRRCGSEFAATRAVHLAYDDLVAMPHHPLTNLALLAGLDFDRYVSHQQKAVGLLVRLGVWGNLPETLRARLWLDATRWLDAPHRIGRQPSL